MISNRTGEEKNIVLKGIIAMVIVLIKVAQSSLYNTRVMDKGAAGLYQLAPLVSIVNFDRFSRGLRGFRGCLDLCLRSRLSLIPATEPGTCPREVLAGEAPWPQSLASPRCTRANVQTYLRQFAI